MSATNPQSRGGVSYDVTPAVAAETPLPEVGPPPLYWRMLRLHNVRPNGWQRALLVEGVLTLAVVLVLADVASAWTLLALPIASAVVVKSHDVLAGLLPGRRATTPLPPPSLSDYTPLLVAVAFVVVVRFAVHGTGDSTIEAVGYVLNGLLCVAIYRYLIRRRVAPGKALAIAAAGFLLSVLAAALGAALEVRRQRAEP